MHDVCPQACMHLMLGRSVLDIYHKVMHHHHEPLTQMYASMHCQQLTRHSTPRSSEYL